MKPTAAWTLPTAGVVVAAAVVAAIALRLAAISAAATEKSCKQRPTLIESVKECCNVPAPNWTSYESSCPIVRNIQRRPPNVCQLECVFNRSAALRSHELNMPRLRSLLQTVFVGHNDFVEAYRKSFAQCAVPVKKRLDAVQATRLRHGRCSTSAMVYAACAHIGLLQHCPAKARPTKPTCPEARAYTERCEDEILQALVRRATT